MAESKWPVHYERAVPDKMFIIAGDRNSREAMQRIEAAGFVDADPYDWRMVAIQAQETCPMPFYRMDRLTADQRNMVLASIPPCPYLRFILDHGAKIPMKNRFEVLNLAVGAPSSRTYDLETTFTGAEWEQPRQLYECLAKLNKLAPPSDYKRPDAKAIAALFYPSWDIALKMRFVLELGVVRTFGSTVVPGTIRTLGSTAMLEIITELAPHFNDEMWKFAENVCSIESCGSMDSYPPQIQRIVTATLLRERRVDLVLGAVEHHRVDPLEFETCNAQVSRAARVLRDIYTRRVRARVCDDCKATLGGDGDVEDADQVARAHGATLGSLSLPFTPLP